MQSIVLPHLFLKMSCDKNKLSIKNKLELVNKSGLKAVYCDYKSPYEELLLRRANYKLTTLYNRRLQNIAVFMYKIKNKLLTQNRHRLIYLP